MMRDKAPENLAFPIESRKYRSRKQKPCDLCRKRRVCCIREAGSDCCALCKARGKSCTYLAPPPVRRRMPHEASQRSQMQNAAYGQNMSQEDSSIPTSSKFDQKLHHTLQYLGLSGDQDPYLLQHSSQQKLEKAGLAVWACKKVNDNPEMPAQFTIFPDKHLDARPMYYPDTNIEETAHPHKDELTNAYFEAVHTSFPIISQSEFDPRSASTLCLASIYALSHVFCPEAKSIDPWVFLNFLGRAIPLEARNASLDSIEAALLYSQRHTYIFRAPTMPGLMSEIGNLVGMAHDVGLNVDPTNWKIPESEKKRRKRLWWGIYMQDKWSALTLGRPSYLHADQHNVPMLTIADFDDPNIQAARSSSYNSRSRKEDISRRMFIAMADLSIILSDVLSTFYTLRAVHMLKNMSPDEKKACIFSFTERLDQWNHVYGSLFHGNQDLLPDPTGTLQLAYYTLEIALCRAVLRDQYDHPIRKRGEQTVLLVIELLQTLQISRLRAFWWAASKVNFSIVGAFMFSMLLTSIEEQEIESWMSRITTYLKLLKEHSINFDTTKLACIRLELLSKVDHLMDDGGSSKIDESNAFIGSSADAGMAVPESTANATVENRQQHTQLVDTQTDENTLYPIDDPFDFMSFDPFGDSENLDWYALMGA